MDFTNKICSSEWDEVEDLMKNDQFDANILSSICDNKPVRTQSGETYCTPFQWACIKKSSEKVLEVMIDKGGEDMLTKCDDELEINGLQWAIAHGASLKIIEKIVEVKKELIQKKNSYDENAIHIAVRFHSQIGVIQFLIDEGGDSLLEQPNVLGCWCLHYACRHHSDDEVIKLLYNKKPESLRQPDKNGNWPLIHAFDGGSNVKVVNFLLSKMTEDEDLKFLLKYESSKSMMFWINLQTFKDKKDILEKPIIRQVLNESFIKPFYLSFMFADLYSQIVLVAVFSVGINESVVYGAESMDRGWYWAMIIALLWRGYRELIQMVKSPLRMYLIDLWNIIDLILIILVTRSAIILFEKRDVSGGNGVWNENGAWICMTTGFVWTELMLLLSHFRYGVLIFVSALGSIFVRLTPYYFVVIMAIIAYGNMFYVANLIEGANECNEGLFPKGTEAICSREQSYLTSLIMFLSQDWIYLDEVYQYPLIGFLSLGIALILGLVFLTILIAEIQKIYTEVDKLGSFEFWKRRLSHMVEINRSFGDMRPKISQIYKKGKEKRRVNLSSISKWNINNEEEKDDKELKELYSWLQDDKFSDGTNLHRTRPNVYYRLWVFFRRASWNEMLLPDESFEKILWPKHKLVSRMLILFPLYPCILAFFVIILLFGFVFLGLCWSSTIKMHLFGGPIYESPSTDKHVENMAPQVKDIQQRLTVSPNVTVSAPVSVPDPQVPIVPDQNKAITRESVQEIYGLLENIVEKVNRPSDAVVMLMNDDVDDIITLARQIGEKLPEYD